MALRRGFRTEANGLAQEIRAELGLGPLDPMDPLALAELLAIPVVGLSDMLAEAPAVKHLLTVETDVFSAVTVFNGHRRMIIHNDGHAPTRQRSNLSHELSHGMLLHPPTPALDNRGCRDWNQGIEDEANWLAGVLLVTEAAAIEVAKGQWESPTQAARHFGVSAQMLRFRLNKTGAHARVQRSRDWAANHRRAR